MKKVIIAITILISLISINVFAETNKLYFAENGSNLYYNNDLIDDAFMKHLDMVPGSSYVDDLLIENGGTKTYKLYFQIKPRKQSSVADNLLNHIDMKIYVDNSLIYDGKVTGLDYSKNGINLQNVIEIGSFSPGQIIDMKAYTHLSTNYTNPEEDDLAYIDWSFFAQWYDNEKQEEKVIKIEKAPQTGLNTNLTLYIIVVLSVVAAIVLIVIYEKRKENK